MTERNSYGLGRVARLGHSWGSSNRLDASFVMRRSQSIRGGAEHLRASWPRADAQTRPELLTNIGRAHCPRATVGGSDYHAREGNHLAHTRPLSPGAQSPRGWCWLALQCVWLPRGPAATTIIRHHQSLGRQASGWAGQHANQRERVIQIFARPHSASIWDLNLRPLFGFHFLAAKERQWMAEFIQRAAGCLWMRAIVLARALVLEHEDSCA